MYVYTLPRLVLPTITGLMHFTEGPMPAPAGGPEVGASRVPNHPRCAKEIHNSVHQGKRENQLISASANR